MAEKPPKANAKTESGQPSVLGTLPATRPERLGAPRERASKPAAGRRPTAERRRAKPAAKPAAARNGAPTHHGPQAVRPGSPPLRTRPTDAPPPRPIGAPRGTELVTTAIRATGELAQIGFTLGGQALKRAVDRIPRP